MSEIPEAGEDTADVPKAGFGRQQIIATVLTLGILILVFAVVLPQFGDYGDAWTAIQNMEPYQVLLLVLATVALIFIYVLPFSAALPGLRFRPAFNTRQTSFMISNVVPGGGAWGLAVQFGMLNSYGHGAAESTSAIGITSVWNTFVTLSLPVIAIVGLSFTGQNQGEQLLATTVALVVVVTMIVVFTLILRSEDTARKIGGVGNRIVHWAYGLFSKEPSFDAEQAVVDFRNSIVDVVLDRWLLITLANIGQQLAQFAILYFAVVALQGGFDGPITLIEAFAAFSFGRLATFIPIPPGGLGTTDAIITAALTSFGLANNDALAATLVWRAATYFPQVLIGALTLLLWRRDQAKKATAGVS